MCSRFGSVLSICLASVCVSACLGRDTATDARKDPPKQAAPPVRLGDRGHYQGKNESKARVTVFVHGVYGSAMTTWNCSQGKGSWPELMAADDTFKNSDIYVVDYPSPKIGNMMSVDEEVSNIMNRLTDAKVFDHSEVVFLVHSLGGLVTQRLLLTHRDLIPKVKFIYFFSTPDEGAQIAKVGHLFNDDPVLKQMFHGDDNTFIEGIETDWINAKLDMPRYCAFERVKTDGVLVVDRLSATRLCNQAPVALYANHNTIVEPCDTNDGSYIAFRNAYRDNLPRRSALELREWKSPQNVDCNRTNSSPAMVASVTLDPAKREVVEGPVAVRLEGADNIKDSHITLVSQTGNTATINYGFNGLDKGVLGCPGGGHATVVAVFAVRQQIRIE
jgi:pimeloyl-ACP methyl ester carboxylesterase